MVKHECEMCHGHDDVHLIYDGAKLLSNQKEILFYICEECMDKILTKYSVYEGKCKTGTIKTSVETKDIVDSN